MEDTNQSLTAEQRELAEKLAAEKAESERKEAEAKQKPVRADKSKAVEAAVLCDCYFNGEKVPAGSIVKLEVHRLTPDLDKSSAAIEYAREQGAEVIDLTQSS